MLCLSDLPRDLWHSRVWTAHTIRTCRPLLVTMHGSKRVQLTGGTGVWGLTVVAIGGMRRNEWEEKGKERREKKKNTYLASWIMIDGPAFPHRGSLECLGLVLSPSVCVLFP